MHHKQPLYQLPSLFCTTIRPTVPDYPTLQFLYGYHAANASETPDVENVGENILQKNAPIQQDKCTYCKGEARI
jgi:hypothetical protein